MSLHAAILGGGAEGYRVARMLEGLLMAQVALALDRILPWRILEFQHKPG